LFNRSSHRLSYGVVKKKEPKTNPPATIMSFTGLTHLAFTNALAFKNVVHAPITAMEPIFSSPVIMEAIKTGPWQPSFMDKVKLAMYGFAQTKSGERIINLANGFIPDRATVFEIVTSLRNGSLTYAEFCAALFKNMGSTLYYTFNAVAAQLKVLTHYLELNSLLYQKLGWLFHHYPRSSVAAAFALAGLSSALYYFSFYKRYTPIDPQSDPRHRPTVARPVVPGLAGPIITDPEYYIPSRQDEAKALIVEREKVTTSMFHLMDKRCDTCKATHNNCTCAGALLNAHAVEEDAKFTEKLTGIENELVALSRPVFKDNHLGTTFQYPISSGPTISWLKEWGITFEPHYEICDQFISADTRPDSERHIRCGNSCFYVAEMKGIPCYIKGIRTFNISRMFARAFGCPPRDLVVSEELLRVTRRGALTHAHKKSAIGIFENTLSLPINDPSIVAHKCHPLRDSLFLTRAIVEQEFPDHGDF